MTKYGIEQGGGGSEWYFVTDGQWIEGGDMSESTARAIAERLNEQTAEIERLRNQNAELWALWATEQSARLFEHDFVTM